MNDNPARPSLLLAKHDRAHREHLHQHHHNLLHRDLAIGVAADVTETAIESVVTEITATVSVIQQIDVDSNGSTFSILTILANPTPAPTGTSETTAITTSLASPGSVSPSFSASSTNTQGSSQISSASQSLNSTSSLTSSSSTPLKTSSNFASLIGTSNSTTLISSSSGSLSATPNFSNSSIASTTSSSSSFEFSSTSSLSSSEESTTSTSSTSSLYSPSSSSQTIATGYGAGGIGGGTAGSTASTATSTVESAGGGSTSNTPTPVVVGGVVGSVAGVAILIFILLAFIRWKKRHQSMLSLGSVNEGRAGAATSRDGPQPDASSGGMTERRSLAFVPAALANLTGFNKRSSRQTDRTVSSTAGSERGFYRVSGRKLPSVLQSGGDGYGGGIPETNNTLSGTSFYRDSQGFYGGAGSPTTAGPPGIRPESGVPVMRPSPARTPITQQGPFSAASAPLTPPRRPDGLGRSHPSQDGSHTSSRFTEDV